MDLESDYAGRVRSYAFKASLLMLTSPKLPIPLPLQMYIFTENPGCWFLCSNSTPDSPEKHISCEKSRLLKRGHEIQHCSPKLTLHFLY